MEITIGIPFYNSSNFIAKAIQSVLNQTFEDFELIITDDGSTDDSLSIIQQYNDPRIIVLSDKENKGISHRLNQQIAHAKGKYFARMDADDLMFSERLMKEYEYVQQHPEIDVVGSQAIVIDDEDHIIGLRKPKNFSWLTTLQNPIFIHPTVMGKTTWFRKYGYIDTLKGVEDYDLWVRSFHHSKFHILDEPLLFYRDPLKLKLDVYLFRNKQIRQALSINSNLIDNKTLIKKLKFKSYLKCILYRILHLLKLEHLLINKRNYKISPQEQEIFYRELQKVKRES